VLMSRYVRTETYRYELLPCTLKRFVLNNNATADNATGDRPAPQNPITVTFRAPQIHRK
jgi:hypothetical protein